MHFLKHPVPTIAAAVFFAILSVPGSPAQEPQTAEPSIAGAGRETTANSPASREKALLKILEGQRHIWKSQRLQSQAGKANALQLARSAFQDALKIDPTLAEAYTALSEIAVALPPVEIDEAIRLAAKAIEIDNQNFGGHRMLARLYTVKSKINNGTLDREFADKAAVQWREVTRLDPRNAEGWAFRAVFAEAAGRAVEQTDALRQWVSAAPPLDVQFYSRIMNGAELTAEAATMKLATAVAAAGDKGEAARILSALVADDAGNTDAIALLGDLVEATLPETATAAVTALEQAVNANPSNVALITMLARLQARIGRGNDAIVLLKKQAGSLAKNDRAATSVLFVTLSDLYFELDQYPDSAAALESALTARGIDGAPVRAEDQEYAAYVFEKLIHIWKVSDRPAAAKAVIERSRKVFSKDDLFADNQMISLLQGQGSRREALALVKSLRAKRPTDVGLLRTEASMLTMLGEVDAAVALINSKESRVVQMQPDPMKNVTPGQLPPTDRFSDLLFITNLYIRAGRYSEGIETAKQAVFSAAGRERKQIAEVTLASARQAAGETQAAEQTLRRVLSEMPNSPMALNNLGYFLTEAGERLDEAVELIQRALKVDPRNANYLDSLGWAYFKQGKLELAEKTLKEAARIDFDSPAIQEHLGDLHQKKGDTAKAKVFWGRALKMTADPADVERLKKELGK